MRASRPALIGVQPVDVLGGVERVHDRVGVQVVRQRQLAEDAVDLVVRVQLGDQGQQVLLGDVAGGLVVVGGDADLLARLALAPHVDRRGRVVAHQDGRQARRAAEVRGQGLDLLGDPGAHLGGHGLAIDHGRCHRRRTLPQPALRSGA